MQEIIFNMKMVIAILDGRKSQTRRVIKSKNDISQCKAVGQCADDSFIFWSNNSPILVNNTKNLYRTGGFKCPYGKKGDALWVKENGSERIWLEITNIRVEKLQDISETDAVREGIPNGAYAVNPSNSFRILWDSINGKKYPWSSNPWVWVIEFKRINKDEAMLI